MNRTLCTYTVRRLGETCWATDLQTEREAVDAYLEGERVVSGHVILAEFGDESEDVTDELLSSYAAGDYDDAE